MQSERMTVVLATTNKHKVREVARILPHVRFLTPCDMGIEFHYPERGKSFMANAFGKAEHCLALIAGEYPVIADDSGICVPALAGRPGIYSARFGRRRGIKGEDDSGRNRLLLRMLAGSSARAAYYICAAVWASPGDTRYAVQERWDGCIALETSAGTNGFGYDPLFIPHEAEVSVAELSDEEKDNYSHRAKALRALAHCVEHAAGAEGL